MIGRILVSLTAFALAGFLLLVLIGLWDGYEQETKGLGFSGIYERYLASRAGFADDAKGYRAVVEAESAQRAAVQIMSKGFLNCAIVLVSFHAGGGLTAPYLTRPRNPGLCPAQASPIN